jgi:hypothetical protein
VCGAWDGFLVVGVRTHFLDPTPTRAEQHKLN